MKKVITSIWQSCKRVPTRSSIFDIYRLAQKINKDRNSKYSTAAVNMKTKAFFRTPAFVVGGSATMLFATGGWCVGIPTDILSIQVLFGPYLLMAAMTARDRFTSIAQKVPKYISSAKNDPKKRAGFAATYILLSKGGVVGIIHCLLMLFGGILPSFTWPIIFLWMAASLPGASVGYYLSQKYLADYAGENSNQEEQQETH